MHLSVRIISGRVKSLNTWPECQATVQSDHFYRRFYLLHVPKTSIYERFENIVEAFQVKAFMHASCMHVDIQYGLFERTVCSKGMVL